MGTNHSPPIPKTNMSICCQSFTSVSLPLYIMTLARFRSRCEGSSLPMRYVGMIVAKSAGSTSAAV